MRIYQPARSSTATGSLLSPRQPLPPGVPIAAVANGKPRAKELLTAIATVVQRERGPVDLVVKATATEPIAESEAARLAGTASVALVGVGDCGACTAYSVEDAVRLERAGVPTAVVVSTPFVELARSFAATLGVPDVRLVVVEHPVATQSDDELAITATTAAAQAVSAVGAEELDALHA